ncbi:MAG: hypothetical protein OHK0017_11620 [Patescibacteria group bacterium]
MPFELLTSFFISSKSPEIGQTHLTSSAAWTSTIAIINQFNSPPKLEDHLKQDRCLTYNQYNTGPDDLRVGDVIRITNLRNHNSNDLIRVDSIVACTSQGYYIISGYNQTRQSPFSAQVTSQNTIVLYCYSTNRDGSNYSCVGN